MTQTPAGWYPDPEQAGQQRYWDGAAWTDHRAPLAPAAPTYQQPGQPQPGQPPHGQLPYGQASYGQQPGYPAAAPGAYQPPPSSSRTTRTVLVVLGVALVLLVGGCFAVVGLAAKRVDDAVVEVTRGHSVVYRVTGSAPQASISWTGADSTMGQDKTRDLPWEQRVITEDSFFSFYSLSASGVGDGTVACEIVVDGTTVAKEESSDTFDFVICSATDSELDDTEGS